MQRWADQFRAFYAGLGTAERRVFSAAALASVLALAMVFWWAARDNWQPVYTSSDPGDIQAAAEVLDAKGIPYRVSSDGLRLETLPSHLGRARIESASAGKIPGFETLQDIKLGTSPQRERWAYQRALQGELARTVNSLDEVEASRVHLVLPQRSAFLREDRSASASVTVKLASGRSLRKEQVLGITALVAGAVDGLSPSDVVLVDHKGRMLSSRQDGDETTMGLSALFEARQAYESRYRRTVEGALAPILGDPNAMSVAVTVDLDPTSTESTTREMNPDTQVTISEEVREEESTNQTSGGIPGTESNLPETATSRRGNNARTIAELSTNYDYTTIQRRVVQRAGKIDRVSVAVMVNIERLHQLAGGETEGATIDALKKQIDDAVRVAMGFDQDRGDSIAVSFLPFSTELIGEDDLVGDAWNPEKWAPLLIAVLALALFFGFVVLPVMRAMAGMGRGEPGPGGVLTAARGMGVEQVMDEEGMSLAERLRLLVDNFEPVEAQDLNRLVELQEDASAQVLRRWVHS